MNDKNFFYVEEISYRHQILNLNIMAKIILEENEVFEHFHSEESSTILLAGRARYQAGDIEHDLELNVPILTPANQSHILTNIGSTECILGCSH